MELGFKNRLNRNDFLPVLGIVAIGASAMSTAYLDKSFLNAEIQKQLRPYSATADRQRVFEQVTNAKSLNLENPVTKVFDLIPNLTVADRVLKFDPNLSLSGILFSFYGSISYLGLRSLEIRRRSNSVVEK